MRLRSRRAPLLLLLVPCLSVAASALDITPRNEARAVSDNSDSQAPIDSSSKTKVDVGTKNAPVDGKDGMPHEGPFISLDKGRKKTDDSELPDSKVPTVVGGKEIPESNDGVMDDPNREPPKQGTTGTEGGVSEKDKARKAKEGQTGEKAENLPHTPNEKPPMPNTSGSGASTDAATDDADDTHLTAEDVVGLEKPEGLPDKFRDDPHPIPNSANKDHLDVSSKSKQSALGDEANDGIIQPFHSFVLSLTMILFAEVGDKTFLVAALMAMKHDRMLVFSAAFGALFVMTVLSAVLGHTVPALIPKKVTAFLAAGLFLVFGAKLLREGMAMDPNEGVSAEMHEVEQELHEKESQALKQGRRRSSVSPYALEMGLNRNRKSRSQSRLHQPPRSPSTSPPRSPSPRGGFMGGYGNGLSNLFSLLLSPAWVQTFIMTFLGEWGDRSQIATIAMAAGQDYWWVTLGALVGHATCTGVAVVGGRAIAGKVSLKVVTMGGAFAFLVFSFIYLVEAFYA
jgi:putative Ca2+/H+ antiporter (TMEM165/GDT1 family)